MQASTDSLAMTRQFGHTSLIPFPEKTQTQTPTLKESIVKQFDNRDFHKSKLLV